MYDKDKLIAAIWQNPQAVTGLEFKPYNSGKEWHANQYPDGTAGGRNDRTTLKLSKDKNGNDTIRIYCNGTFDALRNGATIWEYLHLRYNTNEHLDVLQRVGDAYGIEPDTTGYTAEQINRAKQRRSEKAIIHDIADYLAAVLERGKNGEAARNYITARGLQTTQRMGAWNSEIKAELLAKMPDKYGMLPADVEKLLKRLFPTWVQDDADKWHDYINDYQLAIPYTNGSGNVVGFALRDIHNTPALTHRKYALTKDMPRGGYCEALKGGSEAVLLVEGLLDAEAMKQHGFTNVMALGGQTPTDNTEDAAKSTIQTLLRYNAKKIIYIPDYEYKTIKDGNGDVIGKEQHPTADATRSTIAALLPHMTDTADGMGFISLHIASLETAEARQNKAKMDADGFLQACGTNEMQYVLDNAVAWYEYELKDVVQKFSADLDTLAAEAIKVYCKIGNIAQRNRLKEAITAARGGYLDKLKIAGLNAAALSLIDKNGQRSTWAERMAVVVGDMAKEHTADGMAALLAKAQRIQHADTYNAFAAQVNITREEMHKLVAQKPDYLQTTWALYKTKFIKATNETRYYENRKISFAPAAISVIAAPTNHGKTLVLLQTAINVAKTTGKKFLYLSIENDAEQIYIRAISAYMGKVWNADNEELNPRSEVRDAIKNEDLPKGLLTEQQKHTDIAGYIKKYWAEVAPYLAIARTETDIDAVTNNIEAQVEQWRNDGVEVGGIFIDYLQLLHYPAMHAHSRTDEVKGICDRLNDMAKAIKLPVIVAAQFNRDATKADGEKLDGIELANIGESAGIENIAEDVYLVWQVDKINPDGKEYYSKDSKGNVKEWRIAPNQTRSRHCFTDTNDKDTLRRGYLYIENLKARDFATGGYCLLPYNGAAGAITSSMSEK